MNNEHFRYKWTKTFSIPFLFLLLQFLLIVSAYSQPDDIKVSRFDKNHHLNFEMLFTISDNAVSKDSIEDAITIKNWGVWFKKNWNWIIYITILLVVLYIIRKYELSRMKLKNQMRIANIETEKLKDIDQLKSRFYANISHEFRTPLTLIKGPLEQMIEESTDPQKTKLYNMMHNNASRLLELINQLLDLSKIESGNYSLKAQQGDIVDFINGLTMSFSSIADQKKITLEYKISPELSDSEIRNSFYYDPDILDKIINNLISNAFKFTQKKGRITVNIGLIREDRKIRFIEISIEDTGIGIEPDKLPHIFDRFYQVDPTRNSDYAGTGVGLSIVYELIRVHKGEIYVQSEPNSGTIFKVRIPAGKSHLAPDQISNITSRGISDSLPLQFTIPEETVNTEISSYSENIEKPWVLIVEDHEEVRRYIIDSILKDYRILQAANASEGYKIAQEHIPDLIVCDVMMPGTDGFKFCEKVKQSEKTSHIPVILLTARADINDKIIGLKNGADDYLTKPFNAEELRTRIGNLIDNRNALRQKFSSNSIIRPSEISVSSHDASFIDLLLKLAEKNMNNVHYSTEAFARDAGLSQSQLHRKLKAIVNMSAIQFIRSVRMHRAMDLLKNGTGNIAEIAYMVGYDDPGYFSKSFRKFFNKLPSEVSKR